MTIEWYAPKPKQVSEVKVTKSSIVFTEAGVQRLQSIDPRFAEATHVRLGWDPNRQLIAIAPAPEGEKGHFKIGRRGRSQNSRTINAAKFFEAFSLNPTDEKRTDSVLIVEDGIALFHLQLADGAATKTVSPIRRRRASKPS